jgi:glycosyltransferase involved in cell wall biosynthesis
LSESIDVSVVVPTHNGARLLPRTLSHIASQQTSPERAWEVIVVDNASTDGTAEIARKIWPAEASVGIRVVREPELGLANAHRRGFDEARGELVSWVEDDNHIGPEWVELVRTTMAEHPEVGACGGFNEPECEGTTPAWFTARQANYACGGQGEPGDVTEDRGYLWGAGLTVRNEAWRALVEGGFSPLLSDRSGRADYSSGGDSEICFALRLRGWRLWFEPELRLHHFIQAHRLDWGYLRRLLRGGGSATVGFDPYLRALGGPVAAGLSGSWRREARGLFARLRRDRKRLLRMWREPCEGDDEVLAREADLGRFGALLQQRRDYDRSFTAIESADWRPRGNG